ncbi:hypothetical protein [Plantactinospora sp. B5E13]|uniref:hypothetical protein n=1 Tax=unclassified Plantactinospora TaxID=2631981 RepID=UPI00325CC16E
MSGGRTRFAQGRWIAWSPVSRSTRTLATTSQRQETANRIRATAVAELATLGVARVSLGSSVAEAAYGVARRAAEEAFGTGTYQALADALDYGTINALMRH